MQLLVKHDFVLEDAAFRGKDQVINQHRVSARLVKENDKYIWMCNDFFNNTTQYNRTLPEALLEFFNSYTWGKIPQTLLEQIDLSQFLFLMWAIYSTTKGEWLPQDHYTNGCEMICYPTMIQLSDIMSILSQIGYKLYIEKSYFNNEGVENVQ